MILFASADRYHALQELVSVFTKQLPADKHLHVLDISGERMSIQNTTNNWTLTYFDHSEVAKSIWQTLNSHSNEWWKLLSLDDKDSLELPELPGIEDLTRIIQLSEVIHQLKNHEVLIVVMPPPLHAIKLLKMAQKGPDLIEKLLEPLLNWWDTTRKSLSAVEKMLRLHLPSSKQLRLTENWKTKFHELQTITTNRNKHNFVAFLDQESKDFDQLQHRFSTFAMQGALPTHFAIQNGGTDILQQIQSDYGNTPLNVIKWSNIKPEIDLNTLLDEDKNKQIEFTDEDNKEIHLFIPGVQKKSLMIKQTVGNIHILHQGSHRSIDIPETWRTLRCQRAQIESSWLILKFFG